MRRMRYAGKFISADDLVKMGSDKPHRIRYRTSGLSLLGKTYEEWRCEGCGIIFTLKSRNVNRVGSLTHKLTRKHLGYMSWVAVFTHTAEFRAEAKALGVKFKVDLTESIYGERGVDYGTAR